MAKPLVEGILTPIWSDSNYKLLTLFKGTEEGPGKETNIYRRTDL